MKKYRILPLLLIVCLLLTAAFPAAAAKNTADNSADTPQSTANVSSDGVPQSTVQAQEGSYVFGSDAVKSALDEKLQANCVLLADEDSGQYYYTRNIDAKAYPASLTKIMTLLLAVEAVERGDVNLSDTVTAYDDCNADMVEGASNADIKVGETMTFEDFLYCAMISSANEACNVVAEYVCGSISAFVQRMNERAQALGCTGTHFANPHGLPNDDHYTTAHDLYRITKEALSHELFATICNTVKHTVPATNLSDERTLSNTNGLINPESPMYRGYYYEYAKGVKTGHTDAAGYCLISTAESGSLHFLSVVCGCETLQNDDGTETDQRFTETKRLFEYGFNHLNSVQVLADTALVDMPQVLYADGRDSVVVRAKDNISVLLPDSCDTSGITLTVQYDSEAPLEAPLEAETKVGTVSAVLDGKVLATCDLVTLTAVMRSTPKYVAKQTESMLAKIWKGMWRLWFVTVPVLLALVFWLIVAILRSVNRRRAKKRAMRARRPGARQGREDRRG